MSITISTAPQTFSTASNPVEFVFSSTNTAQDNFSFYIELKVNGVVHSYHEVFPESGTYGKFDASEILRAYLSSVLKPDGNYLVPYTDAHTTVQIRLKEKYGTPPTPQGAYVGSSVISIMNGALRHQDWIDYDYTDYDFNTAINGTPIFLTAFPRAESYFCGLTESMFLTYISRDTSLDFIVKLYDVSGSLIASTTDAMSASYTYNLADVSPSNLIANTSLTTANFSTCYYYTVQGDATGGGLYSGLGEEFKIYIDTECTQYDTNRLIWLNKFGGFDSYTFTKYSEQGTKAKRNIYQVAPGLWESTAHNYNISNGQKLSYQVTTEDSLKLNSNWIKEDKYNWLVQSLYESPVVYLETAQGVFEPVVINKSNFNRKHKIKEGLISETLTISKTYTYRSQLN